MEDTNELRIDVIGLMTVNVLFSSSERSLKSVFYKNMTAMNSLSVIFNVIHVTVGPLWLMLASKSEIVCLTNVFV